MINEAEKVGHMHIMLVVLTRGVEAPNPKVVNDQLLVRWRASSYLGELRRRATIYQYFVCALLD